MNKINKMIIIIVNLVVIYYLDSLIKTQIKVIGMFLVKNKGNKLILLG